MEIRALHAAPPGPMDHSTTGPPGPAANRWTAGPPDRCGAQTRIGSGEDITRSVCTSLPTVKSWVPTSRKPHFA